MITRKTDCGISTVTQPFILKRVDNKEDAEDIPQDVFYQVAAWPNRVAEKYDYQSWNME
ncbi:MAG: hypothetical protein LBC40_02930 [Dysgonamonadaceae bacterium]|nr:hypothetical protein [Dysgonamonadaceae bacterium]